MKDQKNSREDILQHAAKLFAEHGYNGVSMRELSKPIGLTAAALYHHFPDKKTLYLEMMKFVFTDKTMLIQTSFSPDDTPMERLESLVNSFTSLVSGNPELRALVVWELLDEDEQRLRLVAEEILLEPFNVMSNLVKELAPEADSYMLTMSSLWLILSHFETASMCRFLPGWQPKHDDPNYIAKHLLGLIKNNLSQGQASAVSAIKDNEMVNK